MIKFVFNYIIFMMTNKLANQKDKKLSKFKIKRPPLTLFTKTTSKINKADLGESFVHTIHTSFSVASFLLHGHCHPLRFTLNFSVNKCIKYFRFRAASIYSNLTLFITGMEKTTLWLCKKQMLHKEMKPTNV